MKKYILTLILSFFLFSLPTLAKDSKVPSPDEQVASQQTVNLSPEEMEHQKIVAEKDKESLKKAFKIKRYVRAYLLDYARNHEWFYSFMTKKYYGFYSVQYAFIAITLLITFIFVKFILWRLFNFLSRITRKENSDESFLSLFFRKIQKPISLFCVVLGLYFSLVILITEKNSLIIANRVIAVLFWCSIFWCILVISDVCFMLASRKMRNKSSSAYSLMEFLRKVTKCVIVIIALLSILDNLGANVNAIMASLGIGGMALAFASQDTIANFFGSVSIIIDRPFNVGDWIKAQSFEGNVELIGFRSTRIRTFEKTLVTIPNSILAKESIENFTRMQRRKVIQTIGITYDSTPEQIEAVLPQLREALNNIENIAKGDSRVDFWDFGASSIDIRVIYYTTSLDYDKFLKTKRQTNLAIMRTIYANGLSFAFPSTSVYVESLPKAEGK